MSIAVVKQSLEAISTTFNMYHKNIGEVLKGREVKLLVGMFSDRRAVIREVHLVPKASYIGNEMRPALELYVTVDIFDQKGKHRIKAGGDNFFHLDNIELKP